MLPIPAIAQLVIVSVITLVITGCSYFNPPDDLVIRGATMGTTYTVKAVGLARGQQPKQIEQNITKLVDQVNSAMSTYMDDSELSRLNRAQQGVWIPVSDDLLKVLTMAHQVSVESDGWFDVTVGPLVNLWGFGPKRGDHAPSEADIQVQLKRVGYQLLEIDEAGKKVKRNADLYVDLSAIAKGYAVDKVADYLQQSGIKNFLVEIGGELRAHGRKTNGNSWRVAVESPTEGQRTVQRIIDVGNIAVATSGDYRNFYKEGGKRFSHSIDPKTGESIQHNLASITVLHRSTAMADAYATALNVMGPEKAKLLAERLKLPIFMIMRTESGFAEYANDSFKPFLLK